MGYKIRVSSSVAPFREKAEKAWGLERYRFPRDIFKPVVFFGLYHWADYAYFMAHMGKKSVFWCGSDILALKKNKWVSIFLDGAEHFVENEVEQKALAELVLWAEVRPSYVGKIPEVTFKPTDKPHVFINAHKDREDEYGVGLIERIASQVPEITFHVYGGDNRVPEDQFNKEIANYHCGLRPNLFDGNSEIAMKSVLSGGYPITRIKYPHIWNYQNEEELIALLKDLKNKKVPNPAREWWLDNLNKYPWTKEN